MEADATHAMPGRASSRGAARVGRRVLKALLIVVGSLLALLVLAEVVTSFTPEGNALKYRDDPVLHLVRTPDQDGYTRADGGWGGWVPTRINTVGLRGEDVPLPKPSWERWVLCLGDSFTFGGGVRTEEAWPQQAQALLGPPGTSQVRVLNGGANGWDTRWQRIYLQARGLPDLQPDVVVLGWNWNDLSIDLREDAMERAAANFLYDDTTWLSSLGQSPLIRDTHLYRWLYCKLSLRENLLGEGQLKAKFANYKARIESLAVKPEEKLLPMRRNRFGEGPTPSDFWVSTDTPVWKLMRTELATMKQLCDAAGAVLLVAAFPEPTWSGPGPVPAMDRLASILDDHGIPWVDVQAHFMGRDAQGVPRGRRDDLWLPHDPVHPTAEGQRIMAEAVTELLRREQLVTP